MSPSPLVLGFGISGSKISSFLFFSRELEDSVKKEEPFVFASAPELSTPKSISDSGKHSPGIGTRPFDTFLPSRM